jgi:membrane protease YdiL (CAAX protease family)
MVLFSVLSALIIGSIFGTMDPSILSGAEPGLTTYLAMFIGQGFLIVPVLIYIKRKNFDFIDSFRLNFISRDIIYTTVFISVGAMILSDELNILIGMIIPIPDSFLQIEALLKPKDPFSLVLLIITIIIIAPIGEELLFRGFLQKGLEKAWDDVTRAILFSSLFFAVIHFNPFWIIQIYFLGVLLGFLSWKTNSIIPCIIFHMIINATSLFFTSIEDSIEPIILWNGHINPILIFIGIVSFWYGFKRLNTRGVI